METFKRLLPATFIVTYLLLTSSCNENATDSNGRVKEIFSSGKFNLESVQSELRKNLDSSQSFYVLATDSLKPFSEFQKVYNQNEFKPYWIGSSGLNKKAEEFLANLDSLINDGFDLKKLGLEDLIAAKQKLEESNATIQDALETELLFTNSFFKTSKAMLLGQMIDSNKEWKIKNDTIFTESSLMKASLEAKNISLAFDLMRPKHIWYNKFREEYKRLSTGKQHVSFISSDDVKDSIKLGATSAMIPSLRVKLYQEVGVPSDTISNIWDEELITGIKNFQHRHQLKQSGFIDSSTLKLLNVGVEDKLKKLALNMDRMRKMQHDFPQPYIWVAVPKMELDYVENDSIQFNMRVVVGRKSRPTPSLKSKVENIVFSPPWTVPPTIMKEEVVPGIARRGGSYLARRGLKAYDRRGRVINPSQINASNYKRFSIGQAPGYRSSLGEVKFNMINPWAIYMHDTPHREDFVKAFRAYSSGCVRVHHPKEFAAFLLRDTAKYSYQKIDSICKTRKTIFIPMDRKIDVHVVYLTNALDSAGNVMYLKDVYGWD